LSLAWVAGIPQFQQSCSGPFQAVAQVWQA
jgi:hypothetical protein